MLLVGLILRIPIYDQPKQQKIFDDSSYWLMPEEGFPGGQERIEKREDNTEEERPTGEATVKAGETKIAPYTTRRATTQETA